MIGNQFTFRFIRNLDDASLDDFLRLKKSRSGKSIILTYKSTDLRKEHTAFFKNTKELSSYLYNYFSLLKDDDDPFRGVQLDHPVMPSILFTLEKFTSNIRRLVYMIELHYN
jgi:hypothetical protein